MSLEDITKILIIVFIVLFLCSLIYVRIKGIMVDDKTISTIGEVSVYTDWLFKSAIKVYVIKHVGKERGIFVELIGNSDATKMKLTVTEAQRLILLLKTAINE